MSISRPSVFKVLLYPTLVLAVSLIHLVLAKSILQFTEIFASFGADLPALTIYVIKLQNFYWLLMLLGGVLLCAWFIFIAQEKEIAAIQKIILGYFFFSLFMAGLGLFAMYSPIFQLGSVVG